MSQPLYIIQKLPKRTERGNKWHFFREHPDGSQTLIGFFAKRREAITVGRLLAGRLGKLKVRGEPA